MKVAWQSRPWLFCWNFMGETPLLRDISKRYEFCFIINPGTSRIIGAKYGTNQICQWSHGESNPDLLNAIQTSSR